MPSLTGRQITVVGINYAPEASGIAPYTTALARALSSAGASVHVITGLPHYPQWEVTDPKFSRGAYFEEHDGDIRVTRCRHWVPAHPNLKGRLRLEASFFARAVRVLRRDRSDLVLTVTPSLAGLAAGVLGRKGRPVGTIVQDLTANAACQTGSAKSSVGSVIRAVENALLRRCRRVGVITPDFRLDLVTAGVPAGSLVDVPNFAHIEPIEVPTIEARTLLGWDPSRFTVVHTGNMGAKQGLMAVVEAARLSAERGLDIDFVLMGDGNQREALAAAAVGIGSLRLIPPVSADEYPMVLAAADVLLVSELPGVCQMSLPSKLTSYAAAGKPIVAAVDSGGITARFLAGAELGLLVEAGDPHVLLNALAALSHDVLRLRSLAKASARVYKSHYDKAGAYERYVAFAAAVGGFPVDRPVKVPAQRATVSLERAKVTVRQRHMQVATQ